MVLFDLGPESQAAKENPLLIACSAIYLWYSKREAFSGPPSAKPVLFPEIVFRSPELYL